MKKLNRRFFIAATVAGSTATLLCQQARAALQKVTEDEIGRAHV